MSERGVLYMVWGLDNKIERALERSIQSVKGIHPELPVEVCQLESSDPIEGLLQKARMFELSPFRQTLFLDADTVVLGCLDFGFSKAQEFGLACCVSLCPWARRHTGVQGDTVEYNTGVLFFGPKAKPVFENWARLAPQIDSSIIWYDQRGEMRRMRHADQGSFAVAVESAKFLPFVLPVNWNFQPKWQLSFFGPIKIWHDWGELPPFVLQMRKYYEKPEAIIQYHETTVNATGTFSQHPVIAAFENILALRKYIQNNPNDIGPLFVMFCSANLMRSRAQLFQDLLAVFLLKGKRNGFFVDVGATNGLDLSNTAMLERDFQWKGILAEPAKCWHAALRTNRSVAIDHRCVWSHSGATLDFKETENPELSTVTTFVNSDDHSESRVKGKTYPVETVSLNDLLIAHKSPKQIDYLSIDTEGSELEILRAFNFDKYDIGIITVEHNFREPNRQVIFDLLTSKGFVRLFEPFSNFDDWYVKRSIVG